MTDIIDQTTDRDAEMWARWENEMEAVREKQAALARQRGAVAMDCAECGEAIPAARLKALPATTLCVDCAEQQEIIARRYA